MAIPKVGVRVVSVFPEERCASELEATLREVLCNDINQIGQGIELEALHFVTPEEAQTYLKNQAADIVLLSYEQSLGPRRTPRNGLEVALQLNPYIEARKIEPPTNKYLVYTTSESEALASSNTDILKVCGFNDQATLRSVSTLLYEDILQRREIQLPHILPPSLPAEKSTVGALSPAPDDFSTWYALDTIAKK